MKSPYVLPALTAVIGFTLAWVAKPSGSKAPVAIKTEEIAPKRTPRSDTGDRAPREDGKRPKEVRASDFPLADQAEQGPKTRDEAKMLRLTEALGLSIDQQGEIIQLIEDVQGAADGTVPVIQDLTTRGNAIEAGLVKLLTPEQFAKFQELRVRERENRIEVRSQKMLGLAIENIDLSPEQREDVLSRLRQKSKAEMQAIPAAASLLLDKSMLPTNNKELSVDGVLLLAQMGEEITTGDAMQVHQKVVDKHRQELEELLRCFDGVLTPGQMGQYQAGLNESRQILKRMPQVMTTPDPEPEASPETPPKMLLPPTPEMDEDDESEEEDSSE